MCSQFPWQLASKPARRRVQLTLERLGRGRMKIIAGIEDAPAPALLANIDPATMNSAVPDSCA